MFLFSKLVDQVWLQDRLSLMQFVLPVEDLVIGGEPVVYAPKMKEIVLLLPLLPKEENGFPLHQEIYSVSKIHWKTL